MLIDVLRGIFSGDPYAIISAVFIVITVLIALTVHECSHGYAAYKLGDPTAKAMGRLSLNPKYHLDPVGSLMMLLFGFGWAKPVPVNAANFKNRKLGMAITAFAGPVSNLCLSFVALFVYRILAVYLFESFSYVTAELVYLFFSYFVLLNISLAIFNLIPIPPLDGSRILNIVLPEKYYFKVMQYERYIYLAVVLLLVTGLLDTPLYFVRNAVLDLFENIISLIPFLRI